MILREPDDSCCMLLRFNVSLSPFLYHVIDGEGLPVAEQDKVVVAAGATVEFLGCELNCGDVGAV